MKIKIFIKLVIFCFALIGFVFVFVYFGMQFGWFDVRGSARQRDSYFNIKKSFYPISKYDKEKQQERLCVPASNCPWAESEEWYVVKEVFTRDQDIIKKASIDSGIHPRLILGGVMGEQFRFFGNRRESFKQYFEPLKILASLSNTSFGIAGLKPKTVGIVEENLKNKTSLFYLGPEMENIVDYKESEIDIESARMNRITDVKNPYYSYLYVGLYMRQIIKQWENEGYNISKRPDILATLYNLGFPRSVPKENPVSGGALINVGGVDYTFGDLGYEFYYSGELIDVFPIE